MQEARGSNLCNGGDFTYFNGELWWFFVRSALTLAVNLQNFTAFNAFHLKIMYKICGKKTNFCNCFSTRDHSWVDLDTGSRKFEETVYVILREFLGIYFGYNNATIVTFELFFFDIEKNWFPGTAFFLYRVTESRWWFHKMRYSVSYYVVSLESDNKTIDQLLHAFEWIDSETI